jgi:hypothetical protein
MVGVLILSAVVTGQSNSNWQTLPLAESNGFSVQLRVKNRASLADNSWLALELENHSSSRTIVDNLHYRIEYEARPIGEGSMWSSGLCQGSVTEVFPEDWDTTPVAWHILKRGETREVVDALSYAAAATLQGRPPFSHCPRDAALNVAATAHFRMSVSHGGNSPKTSIGTPVHGIPFKFRWDPPPQDAIPAMQKRLRALCRDKDKITDVRALPSTRLACALLNVTAVTDGITDDELENAAQLTGTFNQDLRRAALRCLFERNPTDRRFLVELDEAIRRNPNVVGYLVQTEFWHVDLTGAVAEALRDPHARVVARRVLNEHRRDWENDAEFVRQVETIDRELAWHSWFRRFGLLAIVVVTAVLVMLCLWLFHIGRPPRHGRKAESPSK